MPTATPTMPSSLIGVSKQRFAPKRCCSPCVQRNTPPNQPTSSPNTTTRSSRSIATACASRIASIIVIDGMSVSSPLALLAKVPWRDGENVLEHRRRTGDGPTLDRTVRLRLLERVVDLRFDLADQLSVSFLVPGAAHDEMLLEPLDRITERPRLRRTLRAIALRVVGRRVRPRPVRDPFDEGWTTVHAGALG